MKSLYWRIAAVAMLAGALAACGDNNKTSTPPVVVPPAPAPKIEDQFGANFGIAYRADPNTDAKDPVAGDIIPLSLTTEAVVL